MGMDLSICRSIIEAHEGRLCVAANKPQGAIFQFSLGVDPATIQGEPMLTPRGPQLTLAGQ
jgi:K+-sensing histidine kinase KdpD